MSTADDFMSELRTLGYEPRLHRDHVVFDFAVKTGSWDGRGVQLGVLVPPNWPESGPHWIHVRSRIDGGNSNPSPLGTEWVKWSRPFPDGDWRRSDKSVRTWIGHVHAVFATITQTPTDG